MIHTGMGGKQSDEFTDFVLCVDSDSGADGLWAVTCLSVGF